MGTRDEGDETRLDAAKKLALTQVRDMAPGGAAMLIAFADKAAVVVQFTPDKKRLENAIRAIAQTDLPTEAKDAFLLAQSLAKPANAELFVFSDGAFSAGVVGLAPETRCTFVGVGKKSRNAGIVALDVRRPPENPREFQVFVAVRNFDDAPLRANLEVRNSGKLVDVRRVEVDAHAENSLVFTSANLAEGPLELKLDTRDALSADNSAFAVIAPPRKQTLLLVSAGNYFLEKALREDRAHQVEVTKVSPGLYSPGQRADVVIFDNFSPPELPTPGNYFFINAIPVLPGFAATGVEENPAVFDWDTGHPAMRFVELGDVRIARARKITVPPASRVLAESRETPLMAVFAAENRNIVLWSFDIYRSNLPLRVAFPILVSNALDWLLRSGASMESSTLATGQLIQLDAPENFRSGVIVDPSGQGWTLVPGAGGRLLFDRTSLAGFYNPEVNGHPIRGFGVSLLNAAESDIAPREALNFENRELRAAKGGAAMNREVWKWFALAALALLILEWIVYHKRIWV
jgi:hypothetical protein